MQSSVITLLGFVATLTPLLTPTPLASQAGQGPIVHTIAPTISTKKEAQRIVRLCRWTDTSVVADADRLLVVVRSSGGGPLAQSYDNLKWLLADAQSQLNDSGAQFHVYFYSQTSTARFIQESHRSYDARESAPIPDPGARAEATTDSGLNCRF